MTGRATEVATARPWREYALGDPVVVDAVLEREEPPADDFDGAWTQKRYIRRSLPMPISGVFIGWRKVQDMQYESEFNEMTYTTQGWWEFGKQHNVALVVFDARRNPLKVPFDALARASAGRDNDRDDSKEE